MGETALDIFYKIRERCKALEAQYNDVSNISKGPETLKCGPAWDGIMCWYGAPSNTLVSAPCPHYFRHSPHKNATRFCTENATWFFNEEHNRTWTNFSECISDVNQANSASVDINLPIPTAEFLVWVPRIKIMQYIGYSLSITLLLCAIIIFASFKKLKCTRNTLHLNVFISFFLKAAIFVVKEILLVEGTVMSKDLVTDKNGDKYVKEHNSWICKACTCFVQYVIVSNYMLILMEGIYLHRLLFSTCPDYSIKRLTFFGWLFPFVNVFPWALLRAINDDELCWTTLAYQYIIHVPIILAVLTNFVLFIKIIRVLASKLNNRYKRLIRGTLVLMPALGVPYMISIATWYHAMSNPVYELLWIGFDQTFTSMQGASVAICYCLLSSDVRNELRRVFCKFRGSVSANVSPLVNGSDKIKTCSSKFKANLQET